MIRLTPEQYRLLCLPEPSTFLPKLANEVRSDYPRQTAHLDELALLAEVERSYSHAAYQFRITHLPTLVRWVKADVGWARGLRDKPLPISWFEQSEHPNVTAADLLSLIGSDLAR